MWITGASRAVLVVAGGAMAFTVGIATAKTDRDTAERHCMAVARLGAWPSRPNLAIKRWQVITFNECMGREGFGPGHAKTK